MKKKCLLAIRIRGGVNVPIKAKDTMQMLRMVRNNSATLLDNRPEYVGMLQKIKDYVTWGEPDLETIKLILKKRGRLLGGSSINSETLKAIGFNSLDRLADSIYTGDVEINKIKNLKPFFRLSPPTKGFRRSIKLPFRSNGELGYRGEAINDLAKRMC